MKKSFLTAACIVAISVGTSLQLQAQDSTSVGQDLGSAARKTGKAIGKGAKKAGNKTAELASKGSSDVTGKAYKGKVGPDGQKIYIDNESKYYWVDSKGHRQYVTADQLKDK